MILHLLTIAALALVLGFVIGGLFGARQQQRYDSALIEMLTSDRDAARHEATVLRGILCPVLSRRPNEVSQGEPAPKTAAAGTAHSAGRGASPLAQAQVEAQSPARTGRRFRRGIPTPFRTLFNTARANSNTPQKRTDALAAALSQQKPVQEKNQ